MSWTRTMGAAGLALALMAPGARAEAPARVLRLVGQASAPAPTTYVIDARLTPGEGTFDAEITGWAASLEQDGGYGEVTGHCVEAHCTLSLDLDGPKLDIAADVGEGAAADGRFSFKGDDDAKAVTGQTHLAPLTGPLPGGLGELAAPDAVYAPELVDLLIWNGASAGFSQPDPNDPPSGFQRGSLADWQAGRGQPATGLITVDDLKALRDGAKAARAAVGWTVLGDGGKTWAGGYPAALLPTASVQGRERHFASADGKAELVITFDPPLDSEGFDALVERETADRDSRSGVNYSRVNRDMEMRYVEGGVVTVASWHSREGGLARQVLRYPESQEEAFSVVASVLPAAFVVSDDFKSP